MSGILFAVLLNFKHIYMYLAVCPLLYLCRRLFLTDTTAGVLCVPAPLILHVTFGLVTSKEPHAAGQRSYRGVWRLATPVPRDGTNTPATLSSIPLYARTEPRILGSKRMGPGYAG